ncbi:retrotransposon protein, putative, ty1-copia subclass [Tanacetum coccineum]|uniref:Retrotransposon protein, putative, ty1-copia subclass n=1 Tax=Tanacetum coccineum TaxID=301880 RepID=A0ABQ5HK72_9ASTR
MAQPDNNNTLSSAFKTFFEREKLTGDNFNDWYRSLRIVLRVAGTYDYLYKPCPDEPPANAAENVKAAWKAEYKIHSDVACLMLGKMSPALQRQSLNMDLVILFMKLQYACVGKTGFRVKRKLSYGEQYLHVGNGAQAAVEAIGVFNLVLPSDLPILEDSHAKLQREDFWKLSMTILMLYVCGPFRHVSRKGASYFLTFTDDFSRYGYVYLLKHKHEVFETFKVFKSEVELQLGKKIKALRSDRGGEYLSQEFKEYLGKNGIVQHLTSPYTPQQNGVSERRNRTLLDMVRSMFNLTTLPLSFWDYALESAVRILNMFPTKKVEKTPYEIWHDKVPNLSYLKVWGCEAYVKRDSADKLQQRSVKCIFVGYPKETIGYYFYFPPENKVIVARYGDFLERYLISQEFSGRDYDLEKDHMDTLPSENTSEIPVKPKSMGL